MHAARLLKSGTDGYSLEIGCTPFVCMQFPEGISVYCGSSGFCVVLHTVSCQALCLNTHASTARIWISHFAFISNLPKPC